MKKKNIIRDISILTTSMAGISDENTRLKLAKQIDKLLRKLKGYKKSKIPKAWEF